MNLDALFATLSAIVGSGIGLQPGQRHAAFSITVRLPLGPLRALLGLRAATRLSHVVPNKRAGRANCWSLLRRLVVVVLFSRSPPALRLPGRASRLLRLNFCRRRDFLPSDRRSQRGLPVRRVLGMVAVSLPVKEGSGASDVLTVQSARHSSQQFDTRGAVSRWASSRGASAERLGHRGLQARRRQGRPNRTTDHQRPALSSSVF